MRLKAIPAELAAGFAAHSTLILGGLGAAGIGAYLYLGAPSAKAAQASPQADVGSLGGLSYPAPTSAGFSGGGSFGGLASVTDAPAAAALADPTGAAATPAVLAASSTPLLVGSPVGATANAADAGGSSGFTLADLMSAFAAGQKGGTQQQVAAVPVTLPDKGFVTPTVTSISPNGQATTIPGLVTGDVTTRELLDFQMIQEDHSYDLAKLNQANISKGLDYQYQMGLAGLQSSDYLGYLAYDGGLQHDATNLATVLATSGHPVNAGSVNVGGKIVQYAAIQSNVDNSKGGSNKGETRNFTDLIGSEAFRTGLSDLGLMANGTSTITATSAAINANTPATPMPTPVIAPAFFAPAHNDYSQYMGPPVAARPNVDPAPRIAQPAQPSVPAYVAPAVQAVAQQPAPNYTAPTVYQAAANDDSQPVSAIVGNRIASGSARRAQLN